MSPFRFVYVPMPSPSRRKGGRHMKRVAVIMVVALAILAVAALAAGGPWGPT